jgi:hypothetical protein
MKNAHLVLIEDEVLLAISNLDWVLVKVRRMPLGGC